MYDKVISKSLIMLKYYPDRCQAQKLCNKTVDAFLSKLKFVTVWYVTSKMLEILVNFIFSNNDIDHDYIDSDIVTFFSDDMNINTIGLNNINLDAWSWNYDSCWACGWWHEY